MIRNITFDDAGTASLQTRPSDTTEETLRLRTVAVSPHEEYQLRDGEVRPISNELAAAILSRKGRVEINLKGVVVDRKDMGGRNIFWHEDSIVCNDLSARERKIYYVVNPHQQDIVHLLDEQGAYIESLPLKSRPEVLNDEQQQAEIAKQRRFIGRVTKRLQDLHGDATREKIAELQENFREMKRVVQTMPATAAETVQPVRSAFGETVAAGAQRINHIRTNKASAVALGRAITMNRCERMPAEAAADAEDWSDFSPTRNPQPQQTTPIESW